MNAMNARTGRKHLPRGRNLARQRVQLFIDWDPHHALAGSLHTAHCSGQLRLVPACQGASIDRLTLESCHFKKTSKDQ